MISFEHVRKVYEGGLTAVENVSLSIEKGEFVTIIGASGCGKTTLLKMVNKLIPITSGRIRVDGKDLREWDPILLRRSIGYVIQNSGLFPHMKIRDNICYVPRITGCPVDPGLAPRLMELVGMDASYLGRYPRQLSGGQQQRVGVARALAADPEIILMDEPLGAVDRITRTQLQKEFHSLKRKLGKTILFVTHDIREALHLGDRVVLMNKGCVEQFATPLELILRPANSFVKNFLNTDDFYYMLGMLKVRDVMSPPGAFFPGPPIQSQLPLSRALQIMFIEGKDRLVVYEDEKPVGILYFHEAYAKLKKAPLL